MITSVNSLCRVCQKRSGGSGKHCGWAPWCNLEGSLFCNDAQEHKSISVELEFFFPTIGIRGLLMVLHGKQVLLRELQVIVVTKPPQDSPGGLMSATLDEESVQEQEPCVGRPVMEVKQVEGDCGRCLKTLERMRRNLWVSVRCPSRHRSCSSSPRSWRPPRLEEPVVCWSTFSVDTHNSRNTGMKSFALC